MPGTLTLVRFTPSRRINEWEYKFVPSATSYPTGGEVMDFTAAAFPAGQGHAIPDYVPADTQVDFKDSLAGYIPEWVTGTTLKNGKLKLYSAAGTELANATYPAAAQADEVHFTVRLKKGISQ